jgi:biopolymer transport protein ExbD
MNHLLEVCLSITLAAGLTPSLGAQSNPNAIPTPRKGISVQMPITTAAVPMPDADQEDAVVVTITDDGNVYLGLDPADPSTLAGGITQALSNQMEKKLYIKADARVPYAPVAKILSAARSAGVREPDLLTTQTNPRPSAIPVPPAGLQVLVGPRLSSDSEAIVVQQTFSQESRPVLQINGKPVLPANLQAKLAQLLQKSGGKFVQIEADGRLPFADVVNLIDVCRSVGAKVVLAAAP